VTGRPYTLASPLLEPRLIINITEPTNTELDLQGRARLFFNVRPLRYKPYLNASQWLQDGTDGGLVIGFGKRTPGNDSAAGLLGQTQDDQGWFPWYSCALCLNESSTDSAGMAGPIIVHRADWQGKTGARITDLSLSFAQSGANGDLVYLYRCGLL